MAVGRGEYLIDIKLLDTGVEARINGVVVSLSDVDKKLKNIKASSSGTSAGLNKISTAAKGTTKANQDLISSSGLAGATLVETGRFISDLPFGITAVTNNLSQLSTLFVTLISKTEGAGNAFKLLGKQLAGPLGFILAFQVVIALLQAYQKEILGFIKGTKGANEATKELSKTVDGLTEKLEENNKVFKERSEAEKELIKLQSLLGDLDSKNARTQFRVQGQIKTRIAALKLLGVEVDRSRLKEEGYIDTLLTSVETAEEVSQGLEDRRIQLSVDRILGRTSPAELAQRELDLFIDTQKELNVKIEDYVKGEEFRTLLARRDKAIIDARQVDPLDIAIQAEGVVEQQITGEVLLTKATQENTDARVKLSDKEANARLRNLSRISGFLRKSADAFGEATVANKAISVASATIDTYVAYQRVLAEPSLTGPLRFIAAAATLAAGLANVKKIIDVKVPGKSDKSVSSGAASTIAAPDFNVVGASATNQLAESVAGQQSRPLRAFVVGKDISTQQELDRNINNTASFGG
jgi:hypothetical protein